MSNLSSSVQWHPPSASGAPKRDANGRQRRAKTLGEPPEARQDRVFSVRLTAAELAEFDAAIAVAGLSRNRALRIAARQIGGYIELDPHALGVLKDMQRQLSGIATNINQIARVANQTRDPDLAALERSRAELGKSLSRVSDQLRVIADHAQRRRDGLQRLQLDGETE